jgi:hypothetical protein
MPCHALSSRIALMGRPHLPEVQKLFQAAAVVLALVSHQHLWDNEEW